MSVPALSRREPGCDRSVPRRVDRPCVRYFSTVRPRRRHDRSGIASGLVAVALCLAVVGGSQALAAPDADDAADASTPTDSGDEVGTLGEHRPRRDAGTGRRRAARAVRHARRGGRRRRASNPTSCARSSSRTPRCSSPTPASSDTPTPPTGPRRRRLAGAVRLLHCLRTCSTSTRVRRRAGSSISTSTATVPTDPAWASIGFPSIVSAPFDIDGIRQLVLRCRAVADLRGVAARRRGLPPVRRQHHHPRPGRRRNPPHIERRRRLRPTCRDHAVELRRSQRDRRRTARTCSAPTPTMRPTCSPTSRYKQTAKTMGEAASHEAGHTFGLSHDGGSVSPNYYDGHGAWAPIMGRPIDPARPVTQWSRGEYSGANNYEDDLAIIANGRSGSPGAGYRPDDHADTARIADRRAQQRRRRRATSGEPETATSSPSTCSTARCRSSCARRPVRRAGRTWRRRSPSATSLGNVIASGGPGVPSGWTRELGAVGARRSVHDRGRARSVG